MNRQQFLATEEKDLTTARIVSAEEPPAFNRLLNTVLAGDGNSFVAIDEDAKGAAPGMTVKLPEKVRRVIDSVSEAADGVVTVKFVTEKPAPAKPVPAKPAAAPAADAEDVKA